MILFTNTTSPFARIVRILFIEYGIEYQEHIVDPWADDNTFLATSPAGKVPALKLNSGENIIHSLFIIKWLFENHPQISIKTEPHKAGLAFSALEALVDIIIGRHVLSDFKSSPVGQRRCRTVRNILPLLEEAYADGVASELTLADIITVVLIDAVNFRFPEDKWLTETPRLNALSERLNQRESFAKTKPVLIPETI